jgi:hypothetical protein
MHTIESAYIISFSLLVMLFLISGTVKIHNQITGTQRTELREEIDAHTKNSEKSFQPELFIRSATIFFQDEDPADGQ